MRRWALRTLLALLLVVTCAASLRPVPVARAGLPSASASAVPASVGALFTGPLTAGHSCTGSVLDTPGGDLVITAAHCVQGSAAGALFVPSYRRGATPDGVWAVQRVWVDAAWTRSQDPRDDVAVLQVAATGDLARTGVTVQELTGGERLTTAARPGVTVTVPGYAAGVDDDPISCTSPLRTHRGFPAFECRGYAPGTSGSPFLVADRAGSAGGARAAWRVVGVIGGFHQGGCFDWRSLSAPFGAQVQRLLAVAEAGGPGSDAPAAGASGC